MRACWKGNGANMKPLNGAMMQPVSGAASYRRPNRMWRLGAVALSVSAIAGVACGGNKKPADQGQTADQWVQTDGAAGRINLDDVHDAYKDAFDKDGFQVTKFEQRVNEIYEGDNIVLVRVEQQGDQIIVSGWEDLNTSKEIDDATDDKLFSITQKLEDNSNYETRGNGANSYYYNSSPFGGFFTGLFLGSLLSGGRTTYVTSPIAYDGLSSSRSSYRQGSGYQSQRDRNGAYGGSVSSRFGSSATTQAVSPARSSYQSRQINSGGFKSSGSSSRSIGSGGKTGSGSSGSLSGGGGLLRL